MSLKITEMDLEKRACSFENKTITGVLYQQLDNGSEHYQKNDFHSVDTAVYFKTSDHKIYQIYWVDELGLYHGFGISLKETAVINKDEGILTDVTNDNAMKNLIGMRTKTVRMYWQNVIDNMRTSLVPFLGMGHIHRQDYPQTIEILFEGGMQLYISVLKITDDNVCIPFTNHLSVFFDKQIIDRYYKPIRKF
jgi:hypothetical protein